MPGRMGVLHTWERNAVKTAYLLELRLLRKTDLAYKCQM